MRTAFGITAWMLALAVNGLGAGGCSSSSCEDTLTCPCSSDEQCNKRETGECEVGVCGADGTCAVELAPVGTACAAGTCNAEGVCDAEPQCGPDPDNCGACGRACSPENTDERACDGSACTSSCVAGSGNCIQPAAPDDDDGCETDLLTNAAHCGACGHDCLGGDCVNGQCQPILLATGQGSLSYIAIDATHVYWTEDTAGTGRVMRAPIEPGAPESLATSLTEPVGIVVAGGRVYHTARPAEGQTDLWVRDTDGGNASVVASGFVAAWALASNDAFVYVTDRVGTVSRVPVGGGAASNIAGGQQEPFGIAVNGTNVFWANRAGTTINRVPISGGAIAPAVGNLTNPVGVAASDDWVCWTEEAGKTGCAPAIGGSTVTLTDGQSLAPDIAIDGDVVYWTASNAVMRGTANVENSGEVFVDSLLGAWGIAVDDQAVYFSTSSQVFKVAK
jgi:hypothetical protein